MSIILYILGIFVLIDLLYIGHLAEKALKIYLKKNSN